MTKILYIAGYGRSGSTILSIILGNHPDVVSVGEVAFLPDDYRDQPCSCGAPYAECPFWKDLFDDQSFTAPGISELLVEIEKRGAVVRLLAGRVSPEKREQYRAYQHGLMDTIQSSSQASIVVDSSKSARNTLGRFWALKKLAGQDVYVIHLIRNGWATLDSLLITGSNWQIENRKDHIQPTALRTAIGWTITNMSTSMLGKLLGRGRYLALRYEDFENNPSAVLHQIGEFCGFSADTLVRKIENGDTFQVGHMVGGNRVRMEQAVRFKPLNKKPDLNRFSAKQKMVFRLVAGWLNRLYGYK